MKITQIKKEDNQDSRECELVFEGRLDAAAAPKTEELLLKLAKKYDTIVLNFEGLAYIASAGMRVLKNIHIAMKKKGGDLRLKNVPEMVMEVLEMTGFAGLLHFE